MKFEWNDSLSTGIEDVDNQHKGLIDRVNELLQASISGKTGDEIDKTVNFLADYVVEHFQTEEKYMKKYDYPKYEEHKKIHDDFVQSFKELVKDKDSVSFQVKLQTQVGQWLLNHINKTDKEMAEYLNSKIKR